MVNKNQFKNKLPQLSYNLQPTIISMEEWAIISIYGKRSHQYLQEQLTCNIFNLNKNNYQFSSYCNPKGKTISTMCVLHYKNNLTLITRNSIVKDTIKELKKYSKFTKIKIQQNNNNALIGIAGLKINKILKKIYTKIPNKKTQIIENSRYTIIHFPLPNTRFILITNINNYYQTIQKLTKQFSFEFNNSKQWLTLDIEAGYPIIDKKNSSTFIPQSINMNKLNGISFNKGCYIGQEIILRAQNKKTNKLNLYFLIGKSEVKPKIGNNIKIKINNNWINTGKILSVCKIQNKRIIIQIILNKILAKKYEKIKICENEKSNFKIKPLFYK